MRGGGKVLCGLVIMRELGLESRAGGLRDRGEGLALPSWKTDLIITGSCSSLPTRSNAFACETSFYKTENIDRRKGLLESFSLRGGFGTSWSGCHEGESNLSRKPTGVSRSRLGAIYLALYLVMVTRILRGPNSHFLPFL